MTPEDFASTDLRKQQDAAAEGKRCKFGLPPRSLFYNDADFDQACQIQRKWCAIGVLQKYKKDLEMYDT